MSSSNSRAVSSDSPCDATTPSTQTRAEREATHDHRLHEEDRRDLALRHPEHQVRAELALAAPDEKPVRVEDQKREHDRHDDGHDVHGGAERLQVLGLHVEPSDAMALCASTDPNA